MRNGKLDKIKEWLKEHKLYFIQAGCVIAIAVIVAAIMIPDIAVTKGHLEATVDRFDLGISHIGSEIADLSNVVQSIDNDLGAAEDKVDDMESTVSNHSHAISNLNQKADEVDDALGEMRDEVDELTAAGNHTQGAVVALNTTVAEQGDAIDQIQETLATIVSRLTAMEESAAEAWLTGEHEDFTLHAKAGKAGTYTATVHLCYETPIDYDTWNDSITDWSAYALYSYVEGLTWIGYWAVVQVSFSIGVFDLEAGVEKAIDVAYGGLPEDFAPDWAYVAIWPVWRENS